MSIIIFQSNVFQMSVEQVYNSLREKTFRRGSTNHSNCRPLPRCVILSLTDRAELWIEVWCIFLPGFIRTCNPFILIPENMYCPPVSLALGSWWFSNNLQICRLRNIRLVLLIMINFFFYHKFNQYLVQVK